MPQSKPQTAVIIVAAGSGSRLNNGTADLPKQYQLLDDKSVLEHTINAFVAHPQIDIIIPVVSREHVSVFKDLNLSHTKLASPVMGGSSRQASVFDGLNALDAEKTGIVLIHDAARPFVGAHIIDDVIEGAHIGGAIPALPITDTLKFAPDKAHISKTLDRNQHFVAQTPQGFEFSAILSAHKKAALQSDVEFTDDASIAEWAGLNVAIVDGDPNNKKITFAEDLAEARNKMNDNNKLETRVGTGYDVHAFEPGNEVILGGIHIPFDKKTKGAL